MTYKLTFGNLGIQRDSDGAFIPVDLNNSDYQAFLKWQAAGNIPTPADALPIPSDLIKIEQYQAYELFLLLKLVQVLLSKNVVAGAPLLSANDFDAITKSIYTKASALLATALPLLPPVP
jgi:hypothetical protein